MCALERGGGEFVYVCEISTKHFNHSAHSTSFSRRGLPYSGMITFFPFGNIAPTIKTKQDCLNPTRPCQICLQLYTECVLFPSPQQKRHFIGPTILLVN